MSRARGFIALAAAALACALAAPALAANGVSVSAPPVIEPPTLISLGFEWPIQGDDNRNAKVEVSYRKAGETLWKPALPLLRIGGEAIRNGASFDVVTPNMFAGSIFDLAEDTAYEVRLQLTDPDGATGQTEQILQARTRPEPRPPAGGAVYHVYPRDWKGPKQQPAFSSLLEAYNMGANGADFVNSFPPRVKPGDVILLHAGLYKDNRRLYAAPGNSTLFDGTMYLTVSGTADKPIVIEGAGDGEVVFDGSGAAVLFDLQAASYTYFEGITVRNADVAFMLGHKRIGGAVGFTLKHSKLVDIGRGVFTDWGGARDFYIADNTFVGRNDPTRLMGWIGRTWQGRPGFPQPLLSEYAVKVFGSGHVIAFNAVSGFHDGIDHATYGNPDDWPNTPRDRMPVALDIYNNDISNTDDNCIEADGMMFNARILRNRCFNQAHRALSSQPVMGGPAYFVRNIVYHAPEGGSLKMTANSSGVLIYNNTFLAEGQQMGPVSNIHFRNNLFLGEGARSTLSSDPSPAPDNAPEVFSVDTSTAYSSSDYNGFRPNPGAPSVVTWAGPAGGAVTDFKGPHPKQGYPTLDAYAKATGQDRHSIAVDWDVFVRAGAPDRADPTRIYKPDDFDFSLRKAAKAIDKGVVLPGVTDGFTGRAPDLGALEFGSAAPHYGPRGG
ncbi:MAG: hypothetical protein ACXWKY_03790 [Caulobacteraceae bacterium]